MRFSYPAVIEAGAEKGFGAFFPDLPGCAAAGDTIEECFIDAQQALILHLAGMIEDGEAPPKATRLADVKAEPEVHVADILLVTASMGERFTYPVDLSRDESGRVVAHVPDVAGCVTDGADSAEALAEAADALEEALCAAMEAKEPIRFPSPARGRPVVAPGAEIAARAAVYIAMRDSASVK